MKQQLTQIPIQVAVGIIRDPRQYIFITQRRENAELAGYWEFPGGKVEAGETPEKTLIRELYEEVGITVEQAVLVQTAACDHPKYSLLIYYFLVEKWRGTPYGREGQPSRWVAQQALKPEEFPKSNTPPIIALLSRTL